MTVWCPTGHASPDESAFCGECGTDLAAPEATERTSVSEPDAADPPAEPSSSPTPPIPWRSRPGWLTRRQVSTLSFAVLSLALAVGLVISLVALGTWRDYADNAVAGRDNAEDERDALQQELADASEDLSDAQDTAATAESELAAERQALDDRADDLAEQRQALDERADQLDAAETAANSGFGTSTPSNAGAGRPGQPPAWVEEELSQVRTGFVLQDGSHWNPDNTLNVVTGSRAGAANAGGMHAFFFVDGEGYIGPDTLEPSHRVTLTASGDTGATIEYTLYREGEPSCCPTGGYQQVHFQWDGDELTPLDDIPPLEGPAHR